MPSKNKKGKNSKLTRMSEEERARYLQHRADIELEAKRRKQQLILIYTKNKLKHEEAFTRINTSKLNEQWRMILRQMKCTIQKDNIEYLQQNFGEILNTKETFIQILFKELLIIDRDHKLFQEAHMTIIDNILENGKERISHFYHNYEDRVKKIQTEDIDDLECTKINLKEFLMHLKTIAFAKKKCAEEEITEIRTKHAINIHTVLYDKNESILKLKRQVHPILETLWQQLNEIITNYEQSTDNKRKQYEYLKGQDDIHQIEAVRFPKIYATLKENIEMLSKNFVSLTEKREETIEDLKMKSELLNKRVCKLKKEIKVAQTIDAMNLKRLSVISNEVIKDLQRILDKSVELEKISKLCSDVELDSISVKKFSFKSFEDTDKVIKCENKAFGHLKKIEGFRDHLGSIKEENILIKEEYSKLLEENNRLKHYLRTYIVTVSKMPTICSITQI
ncbi:PREDICTED: coiled-coil domain-containing protein 65 [Ceratosolen solmsi marchali]|uniref:Dynein regulatory complex subunit 2 n=1 Tax=Ceratosolen solmsi marchali TaxID=326594 RepID=A0AAJ6YXZ7_9HYME|nr:PREDICTED: coiled-coil domain-containing protein 65 [Ceratosolen solmsi marchali]